MNTWEFMRPTTVLSQSNQIKSKSKVFQDFGEHSTATNTKYQCLCLHSTLYTVPLTLRKPGEKVLPPPTIAITAYCRDWDLPREHDLSVAGGMAEPRHILLEVTGLNLTQVVFVDPGLVGKLESR